MPRRVADKNLPATFPCAGRGESTVESAARLTLLGDQIGVEVRVAHYPSYCSKYNPIERRLFPHITRACQGMLFDTLDTAVTLMRRAATRTGLRTTVNVIRRFYQTGCNATDEIKRNLKIVFDKLLPKWNYRAIPQIRQ